MDKSEYYIALLATIAFWPVALLLSGRVWYSMMASVLVYLIFIFMTMLMESDYDV